MLALARPQRPIDELFDGDAENGRRAHRYKTSDGYRHLEQNDGAIERVSPERKDGAMRKVEHACRIINECKAKRDEGVNRARPKAVDDQLSDQHLPLSDGVAGRPR